MKLRNSHYSRTT